jgi:hypothetical protein
VLGVLVLVLAAGYAAAAPGSSASVASPGVAGCTEVSPGTVNLLGALEGQPPVPGRGVCSTR